jgi:hypothetical protein
MTRLRFDNILGINASAGPTYPNNPITFTDGVTTTGTWVSSPPFPDIASGDYVVVVVEPRTVNEEITYLNGPFTAGDTSSDNFDRAQEDSSGIAHAATAWVHGPTSLDFFPDFTGSGIPEGVQVANFGQWYEDTSGTTSGLYLFQGTDGTSTGWIQVFGTSDLIPGVTQQGTNTFLLVATNGLFKLSDVLGLTGSANGLTYSAGAADGDQILELQLGSESSPDWPFTWSWNADGSTNFPGPISTAPIDSHTATTAFNASPGPLAIGTPLQNTLGYDIAVNVSIPVSLTTGGSLNVGVGPSATPTVDPFTPALSTATTVDWSGIVPENYYLLFTTSGTITAGTPVVQVTPV